MFDEKYLVTKKGIRELRKMLPPYEDIVERRMELASDIRRIREESGISISKLSSLI